MRLDRPDDGVIGSTGVGQLAEFDHDQITGRRRQDQPPTVRCERRPEQEAVRGCERAEVGARLEVAHVDPVSGLGPVQDDDDARATVSAGRSEEAAPELRRAEVEDGTAGRHIDDAARHGWPG